MSQVFVPLHNHSHGSTLDGFSSEEEIAQRCKKIGAKAAAITDHGDCGRHFYFDLACRSAGIKPIFGIEAYVVDDVKKSRERKDSPGSFSHACIWALNNKGLENLWTLSTIAYDEDHFYYKPRMDFELLSKYSEGLAISDGCLLAEVARGIVNDEEDKALDYLTTMIDIFGKENVYIELHTWQFIDPSDERQKALNASMSKANRGKLKLAKKLGLKTIAVNDSHYSEREDYVFHDLIWELATGKGGASSSDTETEDGVSLGRGETAAWIMTDDEVRLYLGRHGIPSSDIEEAISNTVELADRCNAELDMKPKFPFITGDENKDRELFFETVEKGFEKKVPKGKEEEYRRRLDIEVEVILEKHFHGYFNVVSDYMKFAKEPDPLGIKGFPGKEGVLCGAARGSAAASLVCYLMDISEIDPVKHDLPFERFLSMSRGVEPGTRLFLEDGSIIFKKHEDGESDIKAGDEVNGAKVSAIQEGFVGDFPDIDSDFPSAFGGDIVRYLASRHGKENVCCVGTYQTSQTKSAFKDVAKAFKIPFRVSNSISKHLPSVEEYGFKTQAGRDRMYSDIPELFEHKEIVDKLGPYTAKMAGRVRQSGAHPSGYIISNESLMGKLPMRYKDGELVSQFDLYACSNTGFIKYDILKISALDIVDMAAREAIKSGKVVRKEIDGKMRYFNRDRIENTSGYETVEDFTTDIIYSGATNDLYNPEIWEPTKKGDSLGIFQMETKGGTSMAIQMQVEDVDDAAIMSAVNRPGMTRSGLAWVFFKRRRGEEKVTYPHPMLEGILGNTQGFFVFQEQVMNMFVVLCNYTMEESDKVRKIVTKKNIEQMVPLKKDFIKSCKENKEFVDQVPERFSSVEECCEEIWSMMEHSVEYSFNSGHSMSYAYLSGWQSWLKVNFLQEFVMASLTYRPSDLRLYKTYAEKNGFKVLPPCVNNSKKGFAVEGKDVRSPLSIVSNVGGKAQDEIILNQPFGSVEDFEERTSGRNARRINVYKNLALSGALDEIEPDRKKMLDHVFISKGRVRDTPLGTEADHDIDLSSKAKIAKAEESVMGISFSFDPMSQVEGILKVDAISSEPEIDEVKVGRRFVTYGQVVAIKHHESKSGLMAWVTLQLLDNFQIEVTMFASMFSQVKHLFEVSDVVLLSLKRDNDFAGKRSYIVNELINMTDHLS